MSDQSLRLYESEQSNLGQRESDQRRIPALGKALIKSTRKRFIKGLKKVSAALGVKEDKSYKHELTSGILTGDYSPMICDNKERSSHDFLMTSISNEKLNNDINRSEVGVDIDKVSEDMNTCETDLRKPKSIPKYHIQVKEEWSKYLKACMEGDVEQVQTLLEEDFCINEQDTNGTSALMVACNYDHIEVIKLLLEKDIQVDLKSRDGMSAILIASQNGHSEVVKLLLRRGAQVDSQDRDGWSPLLMASWNGHTEMVRLLLERDAKVSIQNSNGWSALMMASLNGHTEVVKLLLEYGTDSEINAQKICGYSPLMIATQNGHTEVVKLLLQKGAEVNIQDDDGWSSLMIASWSGHSEVIKLLLENNAEVDMKNSDEASALLVASQNGHIGVVKLLIEKGAQINTKNKYGQSALIVASHSGSIEVVKFLLEKGAQINMQSIDGWSSLMIASHNGHIEVVKLLVGKGAEIDMQRNDGWSALMAASMCGNTEVVEYLLEKGAQVNMEDNAGCSALIPAVECQQSKTIKILLDHGAHINKCYSQGVPLLILATIKKQIDTVELLLEKGANIYVEDIYGSTALMIAIEKGYTELTELLLDKGANVNTRNSYGIPPLMLCARYEQFEIAEKLLERGAQVDIQSEDGSNPLMVAAKKGHAEMVQLLLGNSAQVDLQDIYGHSALMIASEFGHSKVTMLLLQYGAEVNLNDSSGKTALMYACSNGSADTVSLLLESGADINMQDYAGWFPLMYASQAGDLEISHLLLACGANVRMSNHKGDTIFDVNQYPQEVITSSFYQDTLQASLNTEDTNHKEHDICINLYYPGIFFFKTPIVGCIMPDKSSVLGREEVGISLSIPKYSLEEIIDLSIHPCFSGPFQLPDEYESASPAYLITHGKMEFQKEITIRMEHYICLNSEEDCKDMVFLSASSIPHYTESTNSPVYIFKEIQGAKGTFKPRSRIGEISLKHFCFIKIGKRKREIIEENYTTPKKSKAIGDGAYYSARLYRSMCPSHEISAVFCMCLYHPIYTQHCDKRITEEFIGISAKGGGRSETCAQITSDEVVITVTDETGWSVSFDKEPTKILKREILLPELLDIEVSEFWDYPPKFSITMQPTGCDSSSPKLKVLGLDKECSFKLFTKNPPVSKLPLPVTLVQEYGPAGNDSYGEMLTSIDRNTLDIDDLGDVFDYVETLSAQWKVLATKLRIKLHTVEVVQKNNPGDVMTCLNEVLGQWLKLNYDYQKHGKPSWQTLAKSVQSLDQGLFEKIARNHKMK